MKKELIKVSKEVAGVLKKLKGVDAIAVGGGIVSGYADKYSDIDIYCFCTNFPSIEERKRVLESLKLDRIKKQSNEKFNLEQDLFFYKRKAVGIDYILISYIDEKIKMIKNRGYIAPDDSTVVNKLVYNIKLYDPRQLFCKYKNIIQPYVGGFRILAKYYWGELQNVNKKDDWAGGGRISTALKRKNYLWLGYLMNIYLNWYLVCIYALNDKYYHQFLTKWSFKTINDFKYKPTDCVKRLEKFSILGNKGKEFDKKLKILENLIKDTNSLMNKL